MLGQRFDACSSVEANPPPRLSLAVPCLAFVGLASLLALFGITTLVTQTDTKL